MRLNLLKILSAHLRTVPVEKFNLETWDCGTTACAVGHAITLPEIQKQGLTLRMDYRLPSYNMYCSYGVYQKLGWLAVMECFRTTEKQTHFLFSDDDYPDACATTPQQVADRIDQFIKDNTK